MDSYLDTDLDPAPSGALIPLTRAIDDAVQQWLVAKLQRTNSEHTYRAYAQLMADFRASLASVGLDLTSDAQAVMKVAQVWAARRDDHAQRKGAATVAGATYNKRLACISSFYRFANNHEQLAGITHNPIRGMERRPANSEHAKVLRPDDIAAALAQISRTTLAGCRDMALLSIALTTGRRAAELASLRYGDVERIKQDGVILHFRHCKGGKRMDDELPGSVAKVLVHYLRALHGSHLDEVPDDAPLWLSFARNHSAGHAITTQAIADIYTKHFGVSTVHSSRHTFALALDKAGASVNFISRKLGHSSIATTDRYLKSHAAVENPYGDDLAAAFGIGE